MKLTDQNLAEKLHITAREILRRKELVCLEQADVELLLGCKPIIANQINEIVDEFYADQVSMFTLKHAGLIINKQRRSWLLVGVLQLSPVARVVLPPAVGHGACGNSSGSNFVPTYALRGCHCRLVCVVRL